MKNDFYLCSWELMGRMHSIQSDKNGLFVHYSNIICNELNCSHRCIKMGRMGILGLTWAGKNDKIGNILYEMYI